MLNRSRHEFQRHTKVSSAAGVAAAGAAEADGALDVELLVVAVVAEEAVVDGAGVLLELSPDVLGGFSAGAALADMVVTGWRWLYWRGCAKVAATEQYLAGFVVSCKWATQSGCTWQTKGWRVSCRVRRRGTKMNRWI